MFGLDTCMFRSAHTCLNDDDTNVCLLGTDRSWWRCTAVFQECHQKPFWADTVTSCTICTPYKAQLVVHADQLSAPVPKVDDVVMLVSVLLY